MRMNIAEKVVDRLDEEVEKEIDFATLEQIVKKWLLLKDIGIIKVLVATVIANKLPGDPVWLFLVTASGGAKTELIRGLNKIEKVYPISDLTPQTFLSGEKSNKNASLLLRLPKEVILTYKDFTSVLTMHRDKSHAILSQLREIYDGYYRKDFGTGETKSWNGKIGFIAGVTPIIDTHYSIYQVLGERFIQYRPIQAGSVALAKRAIADRGKENQMREEIQDAFNGFISGVRIPHEETPIPKELENKIAYLSSFCAKARSGIVRESYFSREIELISESELPTRLAKQLVTLAFAFSLISDGKFREEDYRLIYKIGMDSLPQKRRLVIETLIEANDYSEIANIAKKIGYPDNTTRRTFEDLHALRLLDRENPGQGKSGRWAINEQTREFLDKAKPQDEKVGNRVISMEDRGLPEMSEG